MLTQHFVQAEFEVSGYAARAGISNRVPAHLQSNLEALARALQRIRDFLGQPVVITSGYRGPEVNRNVGGSPNSHHLLAAAADWTAPGFGTPLECAKAIEAHCDLWGVQQLIAEYATAAGGGWVHVGILPVRNPNQIISKDRQGVRIGLHLAR